MLYSLSFSTSQPHDRVRLFNIAYADGGRIARTHVQAEMLAAFTEHVQLNIAAMAKTRTFIHAGAVGWQGQAVIIPASTMQGKSTLVAALVKAGAEYLSDEFAVLDDAGLVHPYPRPISLRCHDLTGSKTLVTAAELGGRIAPKPLPLGLVLLTQFSDEAHWRPRKVTPARAVLDMFANTVSARISPERALQTIRVAAEQADTLRGSRGEAEQVVDWLKRHYGNPAS